MQAASRTQFYSQLILNIHVFNFMMDCDQVFLGRLTGHMERSHQSILNRTAIQMCAATSTTLESVQAIDAGL